MLWLDAGEFDNHSPSSWVVETPSAITVVRKAAHRPEFDGEKYVEGVCWGCLQGLRTSCLLDRDELASIVTCHVSNGTFLSDFQWSQWMKPITSMGEFGEKR